MNKVEKKSERGAIEIIEEAVHLLRFSPPGLLLSYYTGSLPFVLGLLFFFGDMSRNAFAPGHCAEASLAVALLFIWMKCWHSVFLLKVMDKIGSRKVHRWSFRRVVRLFALQTIFQPSGLFLTLVSLILLFPTGWVFAFYQNLAIERYGRPLDLGASLKRSIRLARLWPRQNHLILLVISLFSLFVFLNIVTAMILIPLLMNKLLGIETVFTLSGIYLLNTTFFTVALGLTFLCIDPIVKTVYALRYFYGLSIKSGDDMRVELKNSFAKYKKTFAALILIVCTASSGVLFAGNQGKNQGDIFPVHPVTLTSEGLDRSIEEVMARPEFAWCLSREKEVKEGIKPHGFFSFVETWAKKIGGVISDILGKISDWLKNLFPKKSGTARESGGDWTPYVKVLLFAVICLAACAAALYIFRFLKRRKRTNIAHVTLIQASIPDLGDEQVNADDLPVDRWIELAKDLIAKGSLRLALRAFYFATISHLASRNMILIAPYKSNRDYETELQRRAHEEKELVATFSENVRFFDRAWYGMYDVTMHHVEHFRSSHERITALAG